MVNLILDVLLRHNFSYITVQNNQKINKTYLKELKLRIFLFIFILGVKFKLLGKN